MRKFISIKVIFILFTAAILLNSCREGTVQPEEFATNPNEPVQINEQNRYTFLLNAVNLSIDVTNNARFSSFTSRISISIIDHSSGYINISVSDKESVSQFTYIGDKEENLFTRELVGYIPGQIRINASNFTGKLRIQLSRTY